MKKFLPGFILFGIVFSATVAMQVGATALKTSTKNKNQYEQYEKIYKDLNVVTIDGKKIAASKLKTSIVLINFWASWCTPCIEEMPGMIEFKKKFKNDITILSLNTDENDQVKNIKKITKKFNLTDEFEIIADTNTKTADLFKFTAIPVSIFYKDGKVVDFVNGPIDFNAAELNEKMKKWISNK
jgi:thiol-disulfide isomerase/thioredoxin